MTSPPIAPLLESFWANYYNGDRTQALRLADDLVEWAETGAGLPLELADALTPAAILARDQERYEDSLELMERIETIYNRQDSPIPDRRAKHLHRLSYLLGLMGASEAAHRALAHARDVVAGRSTDLLGQHQFYWGLHWMLRDEIPQALEALQEAITSLENGRIFSAAQFNFTHCLILTDSLSRETIESLIQQIAYRRLEPSTRERTVEATILKLPPKTTPFDAGYRWSLGVLLARLIRSSSEMTSWERSTTRRTMRWMLKTAAETYLELGQTTDAANALIDLADSLVISTERRRWEVEVLPILAEALELSSSRENHCKIISRLILVGAQKNFDRFHQTYQELRGSLIR